MHFCLHSVGETLVGECGYNLLLLLLLGVAAATLGGLGLLSADTAGTATTEGRGQGEVDVLLGVETDDERGHINDLLADTDVALADEDTSVVDGLGKTELVDASLEATLKEILDLEGEHVIELHAGLVEHTDTDETANQGVAFKETLGVLLVEGEQLTARLLDLQRLDDAGHVSVHRARACKSHTGQHDGSWTG